MSIAPASEPTPAAAAQDAVEKGVRAKDIAPNDGHHRQERESKKVQADGDGERGEKGAVLDQRGYGLSHVP